MGGLAARFLASAVAAAIILCARAPAGEPNGTAQDEAAPEPRLSGAEESQIRALLARLASAMMASDTTTIEELLSPTLSPAERSRIVGRVRGEFERISYTSFSFDASRMLPMEFVGSHQLKVLVPATYEYESRTKGSGMAGRETNSYEFRLAKSEPGWAIAGSDLFEQFTSVRFEQVLGWLFLGGFFGVLVVFFWGWMSVDAWMRTKRLRYALLLLLSTPVGAGLYFFAVYLRRRFLPRDE